MPNTFTYSFANNQNGFTANPGAATTMSDTANGLQSSISGKNKSNTNTWTKTDTLANILGATADSIVIGIFSASMQSKCTTYTTGATSTHGSVTLVDGATTITLSGTRNFSATDASFVTTNGTDSLALQKAGSDSCTITITNVLATGNSSSANVVLLQDTLTGNATWYSCGKIGATGLASVTNSSIYLAFGQLALSGAGLQKDVVAQPTGQLGLSGLATVTGAISFNGVGQLTLSGAGLQKAVNFLPAGSLTVSGVVPADNVTVNYLAFGKLTLNGLSDIYGTLANQTATGGFNTCPTQLVAYWDFETYNSGSHYCPDVSPLGGHNYFSDSNIRVFDDRPGRHNPSRYPNTTAIYSGGNLYHTNTPDSPDLKFTLGDTICFSGWLGEQDASHGGWIFQKGLTATGQTTVEYAFKLINSTDYVNYTIQFQYRNAANSAYHIWTSNSFVYNSDTNPIVFSYCFGTPGSIAFYSRGVSIGGSWTTGDGTATPISTSNTIRFDQFFDLGIAAQVYEDDFAFYRRALSTAEVNVLAGNERLYDASTYGTMTWNGSGQLGLSGLASVTNSLIYLAFGQLSLSGVVPADSVTVIYFAFGQLTLSGVADVYGTLSNQNAIGQLTISGLASVNINMTWLASGQLKFTGLADYSQSQQNAFPYDGSGQLTFTGLASVTNSYVYLVSGQLALSGTVAADNTTMTYNASGQLAFTGLATIYGTLSNQNAVGQLTLNGGDPYTGYIVYDDFTDTNSIGLASHTPEKGGPWSKILGNIDIQSNKAHLATTDISLYTIPCWCADVVVSCDLSVTSTEDNGLIANYQDSNNFWLFWLQNSNQQLFIYSCESGSFNAQASVSFSITPGQTYSCSLITSGDTISVNVNGIQRLSYTKAGRQFKTSSTVGIRAYQILGATWDNFNVTPVVQWTYSTSGQLVLSGIVAADNVTGKYSGSGQLVLSGLATEQVTVVYLAFGQLGLSGLATEQDTFVYSSSGQLTLTGLATQQTSATILAAGQLTFNGIASISETLIYLASGQIVLTGVAAFAGSVSYLPSGQLTFNGVASEQDTFVYAASGQLTITGLATEQDAFSYLPSGQLTLTGLSTEQATVKYLAFGQLTFSGVGKAFASYVYDASGQLTFTGIATEQIAVTYFAAGQLVLSGLATGQESYVYAGTGQLVLSGLSTQRTSATIQPSGKLTFTGLADCSTQSTPSYTYDASGQLILTGLATIRESELFTGLGQITLSGIAGVSVSATVVPVGRISLTGVTTAKTSGQLSTQGRLTFSGSADTQASSSMSYTGSGRLTLTGQARAIEGMPYLPQGTFRLAGLADATLGTIFLPLGRTRFGGFADVLVSYNYQTSGRLTLTGLVTTHVPFHQVIVKEVINKAKLVSTYSSRGVFVANVESEMTGVTVTNDKKRASTTSGGKIGVTVG